MKLSIRSHLIIFMLITLKVQASSEFAQCDEAYNLSKDGQYERSRKLATQCLELPNLCCARKQTMLFVRAWDHYSLGDYAAAIADQSNGISLGGASQDAYRNYTLYLRFSGRFPESLLAALKANELDRANGGPRMPSQYHLGWAYYDNGQYEDAVKVLTDAIPLQPNFPYVYFRRGLAYERLGNIEAAKIDMHNTAELMKLEA